MENCCGYKWMKQGVNDAVSNSCVNPKITRLPVTTAITSCWYTVVSYRLAIAIAIGLADTVARERTCVDE
jgi:hypothetical protein